MKTIVLVELPRDTLTHVIVRDGPIHVLAPQPGRSRIYDYEPNVIAKFYKDEGRLRFEAEWVDDEWIIGERFLDS